MKRARCIVVTALFTLIYGVVGAQIKFSELSHDFGAIAEDGGAVEHIFDFRNISTKPVVIVATHSSCGCTKAEFSRKPIMPDSVATIKVIFNPMNYPGVFARKITIVTSEGALKDPLLITGKVTPRKRSIEEEFPLVMGEGVRAADNAHSFGYLEHGKMKQSVFELFNSSEKDVLLAVESPYSELEFYAPERIAAGEKVAINFTCLLPENSDKYGTLNYKVSLLLNGKGCRYPFIINGVAIDAREKNANNRAQMIALSENFIKFGAVKCNSVKSVRRIVVKNNGTEPLVIRKLELESEGFIADLEGNDTIAQGDSRAIAVEINPSRLSFGAVVEKLRIVSNDPKMPVYTIRVSAIVEK